MLFFPVSLSSDSESVESRSTYQLGTGLAGQSLLSTDAGCLDGRLEPSASSVKSTKSAEARVSEDSLEYYSALALTLPPAERSPVLHWLDLLESLA